jgi:formate/nitrite transporter FocA (FNT family)
MDERAPGHECRERGQVPEQRRNISYATKTSRQRRTYLLVERMQEMVMVHSSALRISRLAITASVLLGASSALASQGPGAAGGTASPLTQLVMAILVYGASALVVGAGLIGALRGH